MGEILVYLNAGGTLPSPLAQQALTNLLSKISPSQMQQLFSILNDDGLSSDGNKITQKATSLGLLKAS